MEHVAALRRRIELLQIAYAVLFLTSLVILVLNWSVFGHTLPMTIAWASSLAAAVIVRVVRSSLVNAHNEIAVEHGELPIS